LAQRIYVGNLPFDASEGAVEQLFGTYGEVVSVALPTDRESGRARGFGFVEMSSGDATKAIAGLNGTEFGGRELNVDEARPRENNGGRTSGGGFGGGGYDRR
jgi:RNA recognition motif-containing protein